jgi:hypothetical protein
MIDPPRAGPIIPFLRVLGKSIHSLATARVTRRLPVPVRIRKA